MKKTFLFCCFILLVFNSTYAQLSVVTDTTAIGLGATSTSSSYKFKYNGKSVGHYGLGWYIDSDSPSGAMAYFSGYGGMKFFTNGTFRAVFNINGNFGIGTTVPATLLHLNGTTTPSASGTNILTIQAAHTSATLGSGGIIKFTNNLAASDAAAIRTYTDGVGLVSLRFQTGYGTGTLIDQMVISNSGNVSIGTSNGQGYKFAVNGTAIATSMTVKAFANWPDYVFKPTYKLLTLDAVKTYISQNHHLPDMPSAAQVEKDGLNLGEMNEKLLKKVEELTLYLIERDKAEQQQKEINKQQSSELKSLREQMNELKKEVETMTSSNKQ